MTNQSTPKRLASRRKPPSREKKGRPDRVKPTQPAPNHRPFEAAWWIEAKVEELLVLVSETRCHAYLIKINTWEMVCRGLRVLVILLLIAAVTIAFLFPWDNVKTFFDFVAKNSKPNNL